MMFDIATPLKGNGWYKIQIKNNTYRTLLNGKQIPTWLNMMRQAKKIER